MSPTRFSTLRIRSAALAAAVAITASACGGGSDSAETTTATTDTMTESTPETTTATTDTMTESTEETTTATTDTVPDDTVPESTEAPGSDTTAAQYGAIGESTTWTSPDGTVTMEIDPTWTESAVPEVLLARWEVGTSGAHVRVQTLNAVDEAPNEFVNTVVANLEESQMGTFTVLDSGVRTGPNGSEIGYVEYTDTTAGLDVELHLVSIFSIANGGAAGATFSATDAEYTALSGSVIPYIETLQLQ